MPVPTPNSGEERDTFISRCISAVTKADPERDPKQVQAMCFSQWRKESMHGDFKRILDSFIHRFGEADGNAKFLRFIELNGLNPGKDYRPSTQFENFQWVEPLIYMYRQDSEAKYYKVVAITANVSMNNKDYSDYTKMVKSQSSMNWRPVNMNHDHNRWVPFPRTRVDIAKADDLSIEAILRVDNLDKWLQELIDSGAVLHPSIEARLLPEEMGGDYHFTGMALLEKGVSVPGDPLTTIEPLFMNESIGKQACKIMDGKIVCETVKIAGNVSNIIKENETMIEKEDIPVVHVAKNEEPVVVAVADANWKAESERESALKDRKIAELGQLIKEYSDKTHELETRDIENKSSMKTLDENIEKLEEEARITAGNHSKELKALKEENSTKLHKIEDGFEQTRKRLEKEVRDLSEARGKLEVKSLDQQKEILDLQHDRNQVAEQKKKAVDDMLEAQNTVAKTSQRFAELQEEVSSASKQINEINNKFVQESREKQEYMDKLTETQQHDNRVTVLAKQILRKMAENKLVYEDNGKVYTEKDIQ